MASCVTSRSLPFALRDKDGAEGTGYTFTVGRNGGAIHDIVEREIAEIIKGSDADRIEWIWSKLWWALHYGGRGGRRNRIVCSSPDQRSPA